MRVPSLGSIVGAIILPVACVLLWGVDLSDPANLQAFMVAGPVLVLAGAFLGQLMEGFLRDFG